MKKPRHCNVSPFAVTPFCPRSWERSGVACLPCVEAVPEVRKCGRALWRQRRRRDRRGRLARFGEKGCAKTRCHLSAGKSRVEHLRSAGRPQVGQPATLGGAAGGLPRSPWVLHQRGPKLVSKVFYDLKSIFNFLLFFFFFSKINFFLYLI